VENYRVREQLEVSIVGINRVQSDMHRATQFMDSSSSAWAPLPIYTTPPAPS
jgi:hypothetical protein